MVNVYLLQSTNCIEKIKKYLKFKLYTLTKNNYPNVMLLSVFEL